MANGLVVTLARILIDTTFDDESICTLRSKRDFEGFMEDSFSDSVYPNPFTNEFNVNTQKDFEIKDIYLYNLNGQKINFKSNFTNETIKVVSSNLAPGIYFFKITGTNGIVKYYKIIKVQ